MSPTFNLTITTQRRRWQDHGFLGRGFESHHPPIKDSCDFRRHIKLEKHSPRHPQKMEPRGYWHVRPYMRLTCYPAGSGGASVIRLSLSGRLANLSPVVIRATAMPCNTLTLTRGHEKYKRPDRQFTGRQENVCVRTR